VRGERTLRGERGGRHHEVAAVFARQLEEGVDFLDRHGRRPIAEHVPASQLTVRHWRGGGWARLVSAHSLLSAHLPALVSDEVWVRSCESTWL
jgi:hypothetical protein